MFGTRRVFTNFRRVASNFASSRKFNTDNIWARENVPIYGALVGISALCFQMAVLYPWHHELSEQFGEIQVR